MPQSHDTYFTALKNLLATKGRGAGAEMFRRFPQELTKLFLQDISTVLPEIHQEQSDAFVHLILEGLRQASGLEAPRILVMPAGHYGQWLAGELQKSGIVTTAFLDNFKAGQTGRYGIPVAHPEQAEEHAFDIILLATPSYNAQLGMRSQLAEILSGDEKILFSADMALSIKLRDIEAESDCRAMAAAAGMNQVTAPPGKQKILFALPTFPAHYLSLIRALRRQGHKLLLLSNDANVMYGPRLVDYACEFDHVITTQNNLLEFLKIVSQARADILYAVDFTLFNYLALLIRDLWSGKMVLEVYDFSDNVQYEKGEGIKGVEKQMGGLDLETLENHAREIVYREVDGLLYRDSPELMARARKIFEIKTPALRFLPYPEQYDKLKELDGQEHIVFCGHILNRPEDLVYTVLELSRELAEQQIHMHFYNPADSSRAMLTEFVQEAKENPFIHYHQPLATDVLNYVMRQYNWAWLVYDFRNQTGHGIIRHELTFTSRLLSYISAGLPIICSQESTYQAGMMEEYGIGIVISRKEVPRLSQILSRIDYGRLCENVQKLRRQWDMTQQIPVLEEYLNSLGKPSINLNPDTPESCATRNRRE